jgi:hypothetical protein
MTNYDILKEYEAHKTPVPSYEEWERVTKYANKCEVEYIECANDYEKLKEENQQLKELLKECRKALNKAKGDTVWYPVEIDHILTQIDNAIGEKK